MKQFLYCLLFLPLLSALNKPSPRNTSKPLSSAVFSDSNSCALPDPSQFNIFGVGTDYFDVQWSSVPGAYAYKLEVIEKVPFVIVRTIITRKTTVHIDKLSWGTAYRLSVTATACEGGFSDW